MHITCGFDSPSARSPRVILAHAGLLKGKTATVWIDGSTMLMVRQAHHTERSRSAINPERSRRIDGAEELKKAGANYTGSDVEIDGKIITADGPASAQKFAETIIRII